jgi:colanic acid biosynthesis glycosyl transferase WcaI
VRILIHGINFAPELVGNGKYTGEMADWLARRGHEVRVVTAPPFNPAGKVSDDYSWWRYRREVFPISCGAGSLSAFRCPLWVSRNPSTLSRVFHLASFALSSLPVMLGQVFWRPSLVIVIEPTAFCVPATRMTARLAGARSWRHIQDFEVDAGFAVGMLKSRTLHTFVAVLDKSSMDGFDRISTITPKMLDRLGEKGFPSARSVLFPNWVDTTRIFPTGVPSPLRQELGIPRDAIVALYSGTMGRKQGLEILAEAADHLAKNEKIQFVFCGDGSYREALASQSAQLPNVRWLPLQPIERLNELMNLADIHLLPQCAQVADLLMPSKLTGILASGRPVVTTVAAGTQLAIAVQDCGVRVPAHDSTAFAEAIARLADDPAFRTRLGLNARQRAEMTLDKEKILLSFEQECLRLVGSEYSPTTRLNPKKPALQDANWKSSVDIPS